MTEPAELLEIRGLARDFAAAELRPHVERWDADRTTDDDVTAKLAELGFFGMLVPERHGGMGVDLPVYLAALEELAWGEAAVALMVAQSVIAADVLVRFGDAEHEATVSALASGEQVGCVAFADADDDRVAARAVAAGDSWTFSGRLPWVANGSKADVAVLCARVNDDRALFMLPRETLRAAGSPAKTMGLRAVPVVELDLDGAVADASARLAWTGTDASAAIDPLGTLSAASIAVGIAQSALEHATRYADVREQFGRPIRSFEGIRFKLAEMATRTAAARALVERAAARPDDVAAAAMAKLAAGPCAMFVTTEAVQVFGGYGYMRDYPVEKLMRDAKAIEMLHGTTEVQRLRVADALYAD